MLKDLDPFGSDPQLRGLVTGVNAHESVNADDAKTVGQLILDSMVGQSVRDISFQRKTQAVTLAVKTAVKVDDESVQIDPQLLFQRLSLIATNGTHDNPASVFKYELCSHPPALFDAYSLPWTANKPSFAEALWKVVEKVNGQELPSDVHYVLDGGALLQRVPWSKGETFEAVCERYVEYISRRYGKATIVFDGYESGPGIKDVTHRRRGHGAGPSVVLTPQTVVSLRKKDFLANKANKQRFPSLLGSFLEKAGCSTIHAKTDADVPIVETAVQVAKSTTAVLVGDDTDLLVLLLYHVDMDGHEVFFRPEPKATAKKMRIWNIKRSKETLGMHICANLPFVHAILGCNSTSRLYNIGKPLALKKLQSSRVFTTIAATFMQEDSSNEDIVQSGEVALVLLYGGSEDERLDALRYKRFRENVASSTKYVEDRSLPPTSAAAKFHSPRVYYQVQEWRGLASDMDPEQWGWKNSSGQLLPIKTDMPPAPMELLRLFRCNCKTGCDTSRCTCRNHGLECSLACGECKGLQCSNSSNFIDDE